MLKRFKQIIGVAITWTVLSSVAYSQSAKDLLQELAASAHQNSYVGTFIYNNGSTTETMRVIHSVINQQVTEKFVALNGELSEIIRNERGVWCYFPNRRVGFFKSGDDRIFKTPGVNLESLDDLDMYYAVIQQGMERIANRSVFRARLQPVDSYRYGMELWIDAETGLLLRSNLFDQNSNVVDQWMFVEIDYDAEITASDLKSSFVETEFVWNFSQSELLESSDFESNWKIDSMPRGFEKINHIRSESSQSSDEQIVYSDNLATVSIFIESLSDETRQSLFEGNSSIGAVNAYGRIISGHQVTVIGEVPQVTVNQIGESITYYQ